jgi:hypothetical protein
MKSKLGATALWMSSVVIVSLITASQAFAFGSFTPPATSEPPASTPAVPEFDGPGAIAAIALLVSVAAIVYHKLRK